MKSRALLLKITFLLIFCFALNSVAQSSSEPLYNTALKSYVDKLMVRFGRSNIDREKFLIQQLRMINAEMKARISNVDGIRAGYFERLQNLLAEVQALKGRLNAPGAQSLTVFVNDLEQKIQHVLDTRTINYKRQKTIEEAVQLLHVAEEMVQLDPNAYVEGDADFTQNLTRTKSQLQSSFGTKKVSSTNRSQQPGKEPTVYDVYKEWKKTELIKYQVRWTDVQILKKRLFKKGTALERERMFKRELRQASEAFNFGMYKLAEKSFGEILRSYKDLGSLDDVLYFRGQCNFMLKRYHQAEQDFNDLTVQYPSSPYLPKSYLALMQIAYHFENYNGVISYYSSMRSLVAASDPAMYKMTFMAAVAALKSENYSKCIELAYEVPESSGLYREARFLLAEAYAGSGNLEESVKTFNSLLRGTDVEPEFRFMVLLKLGYLSYELGDYSGAIAQFDNIPGSFSAYDKVLIGYSWSLYKQELTKPEGHRDFKQTQKYLEALLDNFYGSDYLLEARTLLAYVMQLQQNVTGALSNYEFVFEAKNVKQISDTLNQEYEMMNKAFKDATHIQNKALQKAKPEVFARAYKAVKRLRGPLNKLSYVDMSSSGVAVNNEVKRLKKQLAELEGLKKKAVARGNDKLVKRINDLQLKIYRAVNTISVSGRSSLGLNYFDEHPLARKESVIEHNNAKTLKIRAETQRQREDLAGQIAEIEYKIGQARAARNYREMIHLELTRERLNELANKLDYLDTRAYGNPIRQPGIDLAYWSNYGAFGMTNVRFAVRNAKAREIANFQNQISKINEFLQLQKQNIEHKISQIDDEITLMTRRVRKQERIREREELKRQFEESYFDTHDTELNYDQGSNTEVPKLQNQED